MPVVRVSTKGQIVIPAELRKALDIRPGTYLRIEENGSELMLTSLGDDLIEATRGMCRDDGPPLTEELLAERASDREREERKAERWGRAGNTRRTDTRKRRLQQASGKG